VHVAGSSPQAILMTAARQGTIAALAMSPVARHATFDHGTNRL